MTFKNAPLILTLLVAATLIGSGILVWIPAPSLPSPLTQDEIQVLIRETTEEFSIPEKLVRTTTLKVDSTFSRTVWIMDLPPGVSKTTFHYILDQKLRSTGIQTPSTVEFPIKNMRIHLLWQETVIQTLLLRTAEADDLERAGISSSAT